MLTGLELSYLTESRLYAVGSSTINYMRFFHFKNSQPSVFAYQDTDNLKVLDGLWMFGRLAVTADL